MKSRERVLFATDQSKTCPSSEQLPRQLPSGEKQISVITSLCHLKFDTPAPLQSKVASSTEFVCSRSVTTEIDTRARFSFFGPLVTAKMSGLVGCQMILLRAPTPAPFTKRKGSSLSLK